MILIICQNIITIQAGRLADLSRALDNEGIAIVDSGWCRNNTRFVGQVEPKRRIEDLHAVLRSASRRRRVGQVRRNRICHVASRDQNGSVGCQDSIGMVKAGYRGPGQGGPSKADREVGIVHLGIEIRVVLREIDEFIVYYEGLIKHN